MSEARRRRVDRASSYRLGDEVSVVKARVRGLSDDWTFRNVDSQGEVLAWPDLRHWDKSRCLVLEDSVLLMSGTVFRVCRCNSPQIKTLNGISTFRPFVRPPTSPAHSKFGQLEKSSCRGVAVPLVRPLLAGLIDNVLRGYVLSGARARVGPKSGVGMELLFLGIVEPVIVWRSDLVPSRLQRLTIDTRTALKLHRLVHTSRYPPRLMPEPSPRDSSSPSTASTS